jgi:predicted ATP-dependent endonuclease of OLD family
VIWRLSSIATRGVPGLPDVEVGLQPVTAFIGPRGSGKSRLLAAVSWLLSGAPVLHIDSPAPLVTAELEGSAGQRAITRSQAVIPEPPLPEAIFLAARDRLPPAPTAAAMTGSDAASAEAMMAAIAERRLSGVEGEVLLIEEPELMLTPHQQRHFYGVLRRYAERNQVIYSTRSPALLDAVHYHEILRLDLTQGGMAIRRARPESLTDEQRVRLQAEFDRERTEMFFATCVVLVEGQTERLSLPLIFRRLGHDPDALGISITEVGGKGNLPLIARVLGELGIPHIVVYDTDRGQAAKRENAALRLATGHAPTFALEPDFEAVAGISDRDDKVLNAWKRFSKLPQARIPGVFRQIVETAVGLANGG